jgi:RNA recognition motif-containing protein
MNRMNIYVGNLGSDVNESDLREAFEQYGKVMEVNLIMDRRTGKTKGFGFIEMPEKEEAQKAIAEMNEMEFKGSAIKVDEAKPKTEHGSGGRRGGGDG